MAIVHFFCEQFRVTQWNCSGQARLSQTEPWKPVLMDLMKKVSALTAAKKLQIWFSLHQNERSWPKPSNKPRSKVTKVSTSIILIMWCIYSCLQRQLVRLFSCHGTNGLRAFQANGLIHEKPTETLTTETTVASFPSWKWWINLSVLHLLPCLVVLWYLNLC